jgi:anti-sigma regulatory factor (Ser/Thr protein kinase)
MRAITLTADPHSAAQARAFVRSAIGAHLSDPEDAVLLTSELVANVVRHVGTDLTVEVDEGPPVRIGVRDGLAPTDELRSLVAQPIWPAAAATSGRGLRLLHELAARVGLDEVPGGGKVVWFEL